MVFSLYKTFFELDLKPYLRTGILATSGTTNDYKFRIRLESIIESGIREAIGRVKFVEILGAKRNKIREDIIKGHRKISEIEEAEDFEDINNSISGYLRLKDGFTMEHLFKLLDCVNFLENIIIFKVYNEVFFYTICVKCINTSIS